MSNEVIWILFMFFQFLLLLCTYKFFSYPGVLLYIVFAVIVSNIQVLKTIELFGLTATLGNISYGTIYLATDFLTETKGPNAAKHAVKIGFFTMIAFTIVMQFMLWFNPSIDDFAQESMQNLFGLLPRITVASISAFLVSQYLDVYIFQKIKEKFSTNKTLFIRNNVSTLISSAVDTIIFVVIAFYGTNYHSLISDIFITTYIFKLITAIFDTPIIYMLKKVNPKKFNI